MALALFDLDNTLIQGDSDHAWGEFLASQDAVDAHQYHRRNQLFFEDYLDGHLDAHAYLRFALQPLSSIEPEQLLNLRDSFMREVISEFQLPQAQHLINQHKAEGHRCVIITSTNRFVAEPIAHALGVRELICSEPEIQDGRYTGDYIGVPCYREGKIECLAAWMENRDETLTNSWFYSDSHNDLPLLYEVTHPIAVDPDDKLRATATELGWRIISLRG
jgi:HAD superfamily hydrolase (TIGR01490 family)